jgi:hypothetical protein
MSHKGTYHFYNPNIVYIFTVPNFMNQILGKLNNHARIIRNRIIEVHCTIKIMWIFFSIQTHQTQNEEYWTRLVACGQQTHLSHATLFHPTPRVGQNYGWTDLANVVSRGLKASEKPAKRKNAFWDGQTYFTWHSVAWGKWNSGRLYHSKEWIPNSIEVILRSIQKKRLQIREGVTNGDLGQEGKRS